MVAMAWNVSSRFSILDILDDDDDDNEFNVDVHKNSPLAFFSKLLFDIGHFATRGSSKLLNALQNFAAHVTPMTTFMDCSIE